MAAEPALLQELLGDMASAAFFEQFYLKLPFARSSGQAAWSRYADWSVIDRLLRHPEVDAIAGRQGEQWPGGAPPPEQVRDILAQGYTIGLRHAHRYDDELARLAQRFRAAFSAAIDIHLYATPAGQAGFGWHYDAEEVFILQTQGNKDWWLRKNTVNPWPLIDSLPADQQYDREIMPALHCRLNAGDWLYIPAGYWHRTQADGESISLSVGVRAWTALDVFDTLRPLLADSILWRQRLRGLPPAERMSDGDLARRLEELFNQLGDDLAGQMRAETFRTQVIGQFRANSCDT